jgi:hypothetical protein
VGHQVGTSQVGVRKSSDFIAQLSVSRIYLIFLAVTAALFAPFFLEGRILLSNTDNLFNHYPNLIFGYRSLRSGDLGLWNPFLFAGQDFGKVFHHHMLNPVNWVLLASPESFLLRAITLKFIIEISLVGFLAYLLANLAVDSGLAAIAFGLTCQLSGFTWFTTTTYIATDLLVALLTYIYIILTRERRAWILNYVYLTACFAAILFCGHPAYAIAFLLPAPLLVMVLDRADKVRLLATVAISGLTALSLAAYRIIGPLIAAGGSSRLAGAGLTPAGIPGNSGALVLPGFIPGIWGLTIYDGSLPLVEWFKLFGQNLQFHPLAHFAVLPWLLIFAAASGKLGRRAFVWAMLFVVLVVTFYGLVPVSRDMADVLFTPILHDIQPKLLTAIAGACTILFALAHIAKNEKVELGRAPLAVSFIIAAVSIGMWAECAKYAPIEPVTFYSRNLPALLRLLTGALLICAAACGSLTGRISLRSLSNFAFLSFFAVAAVAALYFYRAGFFRSTSLTLQSFIYLTTTVFCSGMVLFAMRRWRAADGDRKAWRMLAPAAGLAFLVVVVPIPEYSGARLEAVIFVGAMLAVARFLAVAILGLELLSFCPRLGWRATLPFFVVFLFADALLLSRTYDNIGAHGFESPEEMYPTLSRITDRPKARSAAANLIHNAAFASDKPNTPPAAETPPRKSASQAVQRTPNLLKNAPLASGAQGLSDWTPGGIGTQVRPDGANPGAVIVTGQRDSTLFQDVAVPPGIRQLTFGAWVKSKDPRVGLFLTAKRRGAEPFATSVSYHPGNGQWQWLSVTLGSGFDIVEARPHLLLGAFEGEICGPVLVPGPDAIPGKSPNGVATSMGQQTQHAGDEPTLNSVREWNTGGVGTLLSVDRDNPRAVIVSGQRDSTFYQDDAVPAGVRQVAFGAWVKSTSPRTGILLTAKRRGAEPFATVLAHHSGSGQWEWLSLALNSGFDIVEARPHLWLADAGAEIFEPVLVAGADAIPHEAPKGADVLQQQAGEEAEPDLAQYRVNFPLTHLGLGEGFTNAAMMYGIRTYGGIDSIMNPEMESFLSAFLPKNSDVLNNAGVRNAITDTRLLELLGVRYDYGSGQRIHPNALPRFAAFSGFEVVSGFNSQLARIKDTSFDYTTEVLIDSPPAWTASPNAESGRFQAVAYQELSYSHLRLHTNFTQPKILLFNDSLSPDWHAYRNGQALRVLRANAHFMAVGLSPGDANVEFRFEPRDFYRLAALSLITGFALLALLTAHLLRTRRSARADKSATAGEAGAI